MSEELTIEKLGEIMDDFMKENEIKMLITLPKGSTEPKIQDNIGLGCVAWFYILLDALPTVFQTMFETLELDKDKKESLIDGMLELVKNELMNPGGETENE